MLLRLQPACGKSSSLSLTLVCTRGNQGAGEMLFDPAVTFTEPDLPTVPRWLWSNVHGHGAHHSSVPNHRDTVVLRVRLADAAARCADMWQETEEEKSDAPVTPVAPRPAALDAPAFAAFSAWLLTMPAPPVGGVGACPFRVIGATMTVEEPPSTAGQPAAMAPPPQAAATAQTVLLVALERASGAGGRGGRSGEAGGGEPATFADTVCSFLERVPISAAVGDAGANVGGSATVAGVVEVVREVDLGSQGAAPSTNGGPVMHATHPLRLVTRAAALRGYAPASHVPALHNNPALMVAGESGLATVGVRPRDLEVLGRVRHDELQRPETQTTVCVVYPEVLRRSAALCAVFDAVSDSGLDIVGMRTAYLDARHAAATGSTLMADVLRGSPAAANGTACVLVLALRGPFAVVTWNERAGPTDPTLAKRTDPSSLRARFGRHSGDSLFACAHTKFSAAREVRWWFGGRVDATAAAEVDRSEALAFPRRCYTLVPRCVEWAVLCLSGRVPATSLGPAIQHCLQQGLQVDGLKRSVPRAAMPAVPDALFSGVDAPATVVVLRGENAAVRLARLVPQLVAVVRGGMVTSAKTKAKAKGQGQLVWAAADPVVAARALDQAVKPVFATPSPQQVAVSTSARPDSFYTAQDLERTTVVVVTPVSGCVGSGAVHEYVLMFGVLACRTRCRRKWTA